MAISKQKMTAKRTVFPKLALSSLVLGRIAEAATVPQSSLYPDYEEYDPLILDPLHAYGSPYGGFSRATRRRLAALPLHLPELTSEDAQVEASSSAGSSSSSVLDPLYTTIRDGTSGQLYACRVYHEDELDPKSLIDSMFDPPILRTTATVDSAATTSHRGDSSSESASFHAHHDDDEEEEEDEDDTEGGDRPMEIETKDGLYKIRTNPDENGPLVTTEDAMTLMQVTTKMKKLKGLCGQVHKGWWSYEWCNESTLSQFHVAIDQTKGEIEIQDVTSLGDFVRREWQVDLKHDPHDNPLAGDLQETARITDIYEGGEICEETGEPRRSVVHLICCTETVIRQKAAMIRKGDTAIVPDNLAVYDIVEDPKKVCNYNMTVCTSHLCQSADAKDGGGNSASDEETKRRSTPKEDESVMEILDRTMGGRKPVCLQSITGGWWTYEYCHEKSIRQYHEVVGTRRDKTGATQTTRVVETDHNLGRPQTRLLRDIAPQDEWKFMRNATDNNSGKKAYFELEYTNGDICDDHDVRDSAIVAGNSGAKGLARSSSVRYTCGERFDISVSEDSTCHYVVNIVVPDLCRHQFFKTPLSKKQVFKCLPIDDPDVDEDTIILG